MEKEINNLQEKEDQKIEDQKIENQKKEVKEVKIKSYFKTKKGRIKFLTRVGIFSALASVFYIFEFLKFPLILPFLKVNFSNLFIIIGSLSTGPVGGAIIIVVRFLLKMLFDFSDTMFIGELTDVLLSFLVMLPASLIYDYNRSKKGGFIGIVVSFFSWIVSSLLINYFISLPLYLKGFELDKFVSMLSSNVSDKINIDNYVRWYLFGAILPFNAIIGFVNVGGAFLVYKHISSFLKKIGI